MVIFELTEEDFAWFDPATNRMQPLKGEYVIRVGGTSDLNAQRTLRVTLK